MKPIIICCAVFAVALPGWGQSVDAFHPNAGGTVRAMAVQSDGKVVIGGTFTTVGGVTRTRLARVHPDGTLDTSFTTAANEVVLAIAVQSDDKILLGGGFTSVGGQTRNRIARLNSDGTVDLAFNPGANEWVRDIAIESDGRILLGGSFTQLGGQTRNFLGRLNVNGTLDAFNPAANNQVNTVIAQSDGKVIAGGFFTSLAGQTRNFIGRVNSNGTIDAAFNPNCGNTVWRLALQANGKILVAGSYTNIGGQVRSNIARLEVSGALDPGFNPGANGIVNSVVVRGNGVIIAGGNFTALGGLAQGRIASIRPDGTLDTTLQASANNTVYDLFLQPDGRVLVGGDFTTLNGITRNRVGRIAFGPPNDDFANSELLTGLEHFLFANNLDATRETGEGDHAGFSGNSSLWWTWVSPVTGPATVDTTGSAFKTLLAVYTGNAVNALSVVASNSYDRFLDPGTSRVFFNATAGQTYRIVADGGFGTNRLLVLYIRAGAVTGNDAFANAYEIAPSFSNVTGSNMNATREEGEPDHAEAQDDNARSVWWRWTAQNTGPVTLDTAGSAITPQLGVYRGSSVNNLILVASDQGFPDSSVTFQASAGTTYHIAVDDAKPGRIVLNFRTRPANDNFANRTTVNGSSFSGVPGENRLATQETGEPNHANAFGIRSVWWTWSAPANGTFTLDTFGSSFSPTLAVYRGNAFPLIPIGNNDGIEAAARVQFTATQGVQYHFAVDGDGGDIVLNLAPTQPLPTNDAFANAIPITQFPATIKGSNVGTTDTGEPQFDFGGDTGTVWWRFVPPVHGHVTLVKQHASPDLRMIALEGSSVAALSVIVDSLDQDNFPFPNACAIDFPVVANRTYHIWLGSFGLDQGDFHVDLAFARVAPNDHFSNRVVVASGTTTLFSSTVGASIESLSETGTNSVWWSLQPTNTGPVIITTSGSAVDTLLEVFTGPAFNFSQVASNDDAYVWQVLTGPSTDRLSRVTFNGVSGQNYHIRVTRARGPDGEVVLNFPKVALEYIYPTSYNLAPDRFVDFSVRVQLTNLRTVPSGPLRCRLIARGGYSHVEALLLDCGKELPSLDIPDQEMGVVDLPPVTQSFQFADIAGRCPPPYEAGDWGYGYGVIGVLEEFSEEYGWEVRDSRLLVIGNWPRVNGFIGPGGGVITISAGPGKILPATAFIDLTLGPPSAIRLGGQWRVSPTNFGSLIDYITYTNVGRRLAVRSNDFTIEVRSLPGFDAPTNRTVQLKSGTNVALNMVYLVHPPRLFYHRTTGLSITGTPGTAYRIEAANNLPLPITWLSNAGRLLTPGVNLVPNTIPAATTNRFYRARWLPE